MSGQSPKCSHLRCVSDYHLPSSRDLMFRVTAFLITILLLLNTRSVSISQGNAVQAQAAADATSDAENYNAIFWTTYGVLSVPGSVFSVRTVLSGIDVISLPCLGVCLGVLPAAVVLSSNLVKVSPPTKRLMGKSPEYVSVYVKTYTMRVKRKRQKHVIGGATVGCLVTGGFVVWLVGGL